MLEKHQKYSASQEAETPLNIADVELRNGIAHSFRCTVSFNKSCTKEDVQRLLGPDCLFLESQPNVLAFMREKKWVDDGQRNVRGLVQREVVEFRNGNEVIVQFTRKT